MKWIGWPVAEIWPFEIFENVRSVGRSSVLNISIDVMYSSSMRKNQQTSSPYLMSHCHHRSYLPQLHATSATRVVNRPSLNDADSMQSSCADILVRLAPLELTRFHFDVYNRARLYAASSRRMPHFAFKLVPHFFRADYSRIVRRASIVMLLVLLQTNTLHYFTKDWHRKNKNVHWYNMQVCKVRNNNRPI